MDGLPANGDANVLDSSYTPRRRFRTPLLAFAMLVAAVCIIGIIYIIYETDQLKITIREDLSAIADLKATQIANWKAERSEDAKQIFETPLFQHLTAQYLINKNDAVNRQLLTEWMRVFYKQHDYSWIALLDTRGELVLSIPEQKAAPSVSHKEYLDAAVETGKIIMIDLHRDIDKDSIEGSGIFMSYMIPVIDLTKANNPPVGAWFVQLDPSKYLFPIVQTWQGNSKSAETLLVRREGDEVVFLNDLRHKQDTALKLRFKLADTPNLPATKAVLGVEGIFEGVDYRGVKVVSAIRKVYGTSWSMVAKIDKKELYLPLRKRIWVISFITLIMMLALAQAVGMLERRHDEEWLRKQLILEHEKAKLQDEYHRIAQEWQGTFDSISDAIWLLDSENKIIRANSATTNTLGLNSEQLIGKHCATVVHGEANLPDDCPFPRMLSTKARAASEIKLDNRWMSISVDPILDDKNELIGAVHIMRDISNQKLAEEALRESESTFRELFEHMSSGVIVYEPSEDGKDFLIISMNNAGEKITGVKREEIIGSLVKEVYPRVVEMGLFDKLLKVSQTGNPEEFPTIMYQDDKPTSWHENYVLRLESGYVVVIFDDVTESVKAEAAITKLNEELEERVEERTAQLAIANQELEAFSYSVSHDLRSPLRGISGWTQALSEDYSDKLDEQAKGYLNRVVFETQRMSLLIEGLLKLSQISKSAVTPEDVDLSSLVMEVTDRLKEEHPDRNVQILIQPGLHTLGDRNLLEILFTNLFTNAWKFTGKKEQAIIEFGLTTIQDKPAYFVRDNGAGFDMMHAAKLFGAFQRMHKAADYPGTGVGLATVQRIVIRHGGRIWADAKPDEGATFFFTLQELS